MLHADVLDDEGSGGDVEIGANSEALVECVEDAALIIKFSFSCKTFH